MYDWNRTAERLSETFAILNELYLVYHEGGLEETPRGYLLDALRRTLNAIGGDTDNDSVVLNSIWTKERIRLSLLCLSIAETAPCGYSEVINKP